MLLIILTLPILYLVLRELTTALQNLYFHPLHSFPGPRSWIAFPVLRHISACRGTFDRDIRRYHQKYGPVLRFERDSLSFTTAQAYKDIYGYGHGQQQWPKLEFRPPGATDHILFSNDANHARFRKALSHAFSEQALKLQESLIRQYVDLLILSLQEEAREGRDVDMTMWYNLTTFDIISDLAFGEPSNCLKNKTYGESIETIFRFIKIVPFISIARFLPTVWKAISFFMGTRIARSRDQLFAIGKNAALTRKADRTKDSRNDFMASLLKHSETKEPITDAELGANAHILFIAGSETTSTLLAGVTYYLLRTPDALHRAVHEVRTAFPYEADITFSSASAKLPYMLACLEEGLRMYPPVPTVLLRTTPADTPSTVSSHQIPPNTNVGVHQLSANYAPANFSTPDEFHPDRWLPEATTDPSSPFHDDNRDARQPFLLGPRNCIGKNLAFSEMRQILARVLWNFDLELVEKRESWDWADQKTHVVWEKGALMCRIKARVVEKEGGRT